MSIGNFNTDRISRQTTIMLCVLIGITAGLIICSVMIPPPGEMNDPELLKLVPWTFAFCTLFVAREAIKEGLGVKYKHGNTEISVDKDGKEDNNDESNTD